MVAAPAVIPFKFRITPMAAELIGSVRSIPIITETSIPIIKGCCSVANIIIVPSQVINFDIDGPISNPAADPLRIVISGVMIISIFVFPLITCPISIPIKAAINAPRGSPGPASNMAPVSVITVPYNILDENPPITLATAADIVTRGLSLNL